MDTKRLAPGGDSRLAREMVYGSSAIIGHVLCECAQRTRQKGIATRKRSVFSLKGPGLGPLLKSAAAPGSAAGRELPGTRAPRDLGKRATSGCAHRPPPAGKSAHEEPPWWRKENCGQRLPAGPGNASCGQTPARAAAPGPQGSADGPNASAGQMKRRPMSTEAPVGMALRFQRLPPRCWDRLLPGLAGGFGCVPCCFSKPDHTSRCLYCPPHRGQPHDLADFAMLASANLSRARCGGHAVGGRACVCVGGCGVRFVRFACAVVNAT